MTECINVSKEIILGSTTPTRDFNFVDDIVNGFICALSSDNAIGEVINLGSNFEISIKDLAHKISDIIDFKGKISWDKNMPDGTPRKKLDTTKVNFLGWSAKTNLNDGLKLTINSFEKEIATNKIRI